MPVYNTALFLRNSIESILNQTFTDFEFIIIDDGSTDGSFEIIKSYKDPRIVLVRNIENKGLVFSLNSAISIAKGEFIARMDSDDISTKDRFEIQYQFLKENNNFILCSSSYELIPSKSIIRPGITNDAIRNVLFLSNPICHPSVMLRRKVLIENNLSYNNYFYTAEDLLLWTELTQFGEFKIFSEVLLKYRIHCNQISTIKSELQNRLSFNIMLNYLLVSLKRERIISDYNEYFFYNCLIGNNEFNFLLKALIALNKANNSKGISKYQKEVSTKYMGLIEMKLKNHIAYRNLTNLMRLIVCYPKIKPYFSVSFKFCIHSLYYSLSKLLK